MAKKIYVQKNNYHKLAVYLQAQTNPNKLTPMKKTILSLLVVSSLLVAACGQAPKKTAENTEAEVEAAVEEAIDDVTTATDSIVAEAAEIVEQVAE